MSTPALGDIVVTIKVNHNGRMGRYKLPLRDMAATALEDKLRACLKIDPSTDAIFERYSDSASAFVVLDRTNASVYKQLYRAAKAKQRLKIKVTTPTEEEPASALESSVEPAPEGVKTEEFHSPQVPKPATVEDEPEQSAPVPFEMAEVTKMDSTVPDGSSGFTSTVNTNIWDDPPPSAKPIELDSTRFPTLKPLSPWHDHPLISQFQQLQTAQAEQNPPPARPAKEPIVQDSIVAESQPSNPPSAERPGFAVSCNNCDAIIPDAHYHCQTCDDGDYDLCQSCVDNGVTCPGEEHWLIKRFVRGGQIINSTTEKISPKLKPKLKLEVEEQKQLEPLKPSFSFDAPTCEGICPPKGISSRIVPIIQEAQRLTPIRTCNCCVQELPENQFVHCKNCDDFDLCRQCFVKDAHGHHPGHAFELAVPNDMTDALVNIRLNPGRNQSHHAICDGCDKPIRGVRHKCLDCPDWDYCSECVVNANFVHEGHRFVPIYGRIQSNMSKTLHVGICCDGPLCVTRRGRYIQGVRYKCAVCHDTDFCGNCEASPANTHNKTHPLIKFKTPVRHVTVTTTGDKRAGEPLPTMGDRTRNGTSSRATSTHSTSSNKMSSTPIQTVVDVKPAEPAPEPKPVEFKPVEVIKQLPSAPVAIPAQEDLKAVYVRDTVIDGTVMSPSHVFEQTWTLRNEGKVAWPANCSVKFVGGDYMGHIDPSHPTGVSDLISANESTVCYQPLEPDKEFSFNVLLRTPPRAGKAVSYWRLTTPDGYRFGHRLWCDVTVVKKEEPTEESKTESKEDSQSESQMIFPKLEKESPVASVHEDAKPEVTSSHNEEKEADELEDDDDDDWVAEDDSVLTDDEYDLIDASDEEYCEMMEKNGK